MHVSVNTRSMRGTIVLTWQGDSGASVHGAWASVNYRPLRPARDCCLAQLGRACSASGSTTHPTVLPSMASNISKKRKVRRASSRTSFFKALFAHYLRPTMEYERLSEPSEIEWLTICCEGELCVR